MKLLVSLGCRVVFALDKDVCIRDDHNIKRLKQFVNVEYIWDKEDLLGDTMNTGGYSTMYAMLWGTIRRNGNTS